MLLQWYFCLIPLFVSLPHRVHSFGMHLMEIADTDRSQIVCTLALLQKYFQYGEPLSGSIISMSFTTASLHIQQNLLNALHTQLAVPWTVVVRNPRQAAHNVRSTMALHEKPQCYFIVIENLEDGDLEDVFEDWKTNINWNPLAQFVVYLASSEETDDEMTELMIEVLLSFMNKKIYNVNVIGRNDENGFYYGKAVFPYHPDNNCGNRVIAIETLDMCDYQADIKPKFNFDEEDGGEEVDYDGEDDDGGQGDDYGNYEDKSGENDKGENENRDEDGDEDGEEDGNGNIDQDTDDNKSDGEGDTNIDGETDVGKMDRNNDEESDVVGDEVSDVDGNESVQEEYDSERGEEGEIEIYSTRNEIEIEKDFKYESEKEDKYKDQGEPKASEGVSKGNGKIKEILAVNDKEVKRDDDVNVVEILEEAVNDKEVKRDDDVNVVEILEEAGNINDYGTRFNKEVEYIMVNETINDNGEERQIGVGLSDVEYETKTDNKYRIVLHGFLEYNGKTKGNEEVEEILKNGNEKQNPRNDQLGRLEYQNDYTKKENELNGVKYGKKIGGREENTKDNEKAIKEYITENDKDSNNNWSYTNFGHRSPSNIKAATETSSKTTSDGKRKFKVKRDSKVTRKKRNLHQKKYLPKHQKLIEYKQDDTNDMQTQKLYIQELYRASFFDKFPKDLSGCPVVAAFRPWEPYIFKVPSEHESKADKKHGADESYEDLATEAAVYDTENEENGEGSDNDSYNDADEDAAADNTYNDVDTAELNDEPALKLNGIEYQLVQTIGERLHITIDLQLENNNLYHLFQQLIDGDIEMILGGIDEDPSISQFVSSSIAYHQDDLTWCVTRAKRKYDLFNFLQSFHISTWLCTLAFILISTLNICLAQKLLNIRLTFFGGFFATFVRILGVILSQSTQLTRLPGSLHITFGSTFFLAIMFVNVYQSFLVSTLTTPKSTYQISHLEEIYRNRMTVTGSVENVRHLNKDGEIFKYIREKFQMCYNIEACLNRAASDENLAVAVSRQHAFYNPHIKRDQLYCFDRNENLYVYLVTMLLPKKFHLLHKINPVIQHIIESGHMHKWARELDLKRRIREEIQRAQKVLVKSLTIKQVGGSFALHGMLSTLALIIFLLECWTHWMVVKRRTRLRLIKWLHRQFSSK